MFWEKLEIKSPGENKRNRGNHGVTLYNDVKILRATLQNVTTIRSNWYFTQVVFYQIGCVHVSCVDFG